MSHSPRVLIRFSATIGLTVLHLLFSPGLMAETWKITSAKFPPYSSPDLPGQGTAITKLRETLAAEGIELEVEFYPWQRSQLYAEKPEYVGFYPAWPEEVGDNFIASEPVVQSKVGVLYRADNPIEWDSMNDLFKRNRVTLIQGYVFSDAVEEAARQNPENVGSAPHERNVVQMLEHGHIDATVTDIRVMLYYANQLGVDNIEASPRGVEYKPLVLAFNDREENKARLELLNALME